MKFILQIAYTDEVYFDPKVTIKRFLFYYRDQPTNWKSTFEIAPCVLYVYKIEPRMKSLGATEWPVSYEIPK